MKAWRLWLGVAGFALIGLSTSLPGQADPTPQGPGRPEWQVGDWWLLHGRERARFVRMSDPPWVAAPVYRLEVTDVRPCGPHRCFAVEVRAFPSVAAGRRGGRSERPLAQLAYRRPDLELADVQVHLPAGDPLRGAEAQQYLPFPVRVPDFARQRGVASTWTDRGGKRFASVTIPFETGAQVWTAAAPWWTAWRDADHELNLVDASWWRDRRRRPDFLGAAARAAERDPAGPSGQLSRQRERAGPPPSPPVRPTRADNPAPDVGRGPAESPTATVPTVMIDRAHDNFFAYGRFAELARADGWRVEFQPGPWTAAALSHARAVVVPLPQRAYAAAEFAALRAFVEAGGGLLLALEGGPPDAPWSVPSRQLVEAFGFGLDQAPAHDGERGLLGVEAIPLRPVAGHPIGKGVGRADAFRAFPVSGGRPLLTTGASAEPADAAVVAAQALGRGRVAVSGDANLFDDVFGLGPAAANETLVTNLLDWLGRREPAELRYTVRGPAIPGGRLPITLAAGRMRADHRGTQVVHLRAEAGGVLSALLYLSVTDTHPPRLRVDKLVVEWPEYGVWPVGEERPVGDRPLRVPFSIEHGARSMEVEVQLIPPPAPTEEHP